MEEKKLRVLMLEDSVDDALLMEHMLRKEQISFVYERVDTREEYVQAIVRFKPDVVLSDHGLPGFNSREALKICLQSSVKTPFILVSGTVSDDYAIACLRNGADDYILKSNMSRLPSAILAAIKKRQLELLRHEARQTLRKQNKELRKVNRELDNFVYSVSHNLRGPLASVMGLLNLAREEKDLSQIKMLHTMMDYSIGKLDDTLMEILEFSKNARNEIVVDQINWQKILKVCWDNVEYLNTGNPINKQINLKTDRPFYGDEERLKTLLTNLLSNAILFQSEARELVINITITISEEEVIISVQDNGIGIAAAALPNVFNMFYRGSEKSQGAGLGLYIAREIVLRLKGKIEIQSTLDVGSNVTIRIPHARPKVGLN